MLGGGYISIRSPYMLYAGEVCYEDIYSLFPFDNGLYLCSITGSDLKANFLYTDNQNYFICMSDYGASVSISDSLTYYIITDAYSAFYKPNHLTIVEALSEEVFARDLIAQYIKEGGFDADAPEEGGGAGEGSGGEEVLDELKVTEIADVLQDMNAAGVNVEVGPYYVLGRIVDDPQETYGNCTIRDLHGNEIYIYGLRGANDERYDALAYQPKKGDTVLVLGNALLYQKDAESELLPELKNVRIQRCFETVPISEALSIGNALQDNASTAEEYAVLGRIVSEPHEVYGNCTVAEDENETLYIYGLYDESGNVRYDSFAEQPGLSDLVIVKGQIKKYVKASGEVLIEFEKGRMIFFCSEE